MFTGIIETLGKITGLRHEQGNLHITVESSIAAELKIDQSVAHNGVCLTVIALSDGHHTVTAIQETLDKTNLNELKLGDLVNIGERVRYVITGWLPEHKGAERYRQGVLSGEIRRPEPEVE